MGLHASLTVFSKLVMGGVEDGADGGGGSVQNGEHDELEDETPRLFEAGPIAVECGGLLGAGRARPGTCAGADRLAESDRRACL